MSADTPRYALWPQTRFDGMMPPMASPSALQSPDGTVLPTRVDKPWGHEIWYAHTDRYAGKIIVVEPGQRLSLQYHEVKDETSYLLSGRLRLWQGESAESLVEHEVEPGESWRNRTGLVHTIEAIETATVLEVSTPELSDVVRLKDQYGRAGTSAP